MLILSQITDLRSWFIPQHTRRKSVISGELQARIRNIAGFVSTYETYALLKFLPSSLFPIRPTDSSSGNNPYCSKASFRAGIKKRTVRCVPKSGNGKGTNHYSPNLICQTTMEIHPIAVIKKKRMRKRTVTLRMTTSPRSSPAKRARMSRRRKRSPANARAVHKRRPDRMEPTIGIPPSFQ